MVAVPLHAFLEELESNKERTHHFTRTKLLSSNEHWEEYHIVPVFSPAEASLPRIFSAKIFSVDYQTKETDTNRNESILSRQFAFIVCVCMFVWSIWPCPRFAEWMGPGVSINVLQTMAA